MNVRAIKFILFSMIFLLFSTNAFTEIKEITKGKLYYCLLDLESTEVISIMKIEGGYLLLYRDMVTYVSDPSYKNDALFLPMINKFDNEFLKPKTIKKPEPPKKQKTSYDSYAPPPPPPPPPTASVPKMNPQQFAEIIVAIDKEKDSSKKEVVKTQLLQKFNLTSKDYDDFKYALNRSPKLGEQVQAALEALKKSEAGIVEDETD